jgi:hypothetical protein
MKVKGREMHRGLFCVRAPLKIFLRLQRQIPEYGSGVDGWIPWLAQR